MNKIYWERFRSVLISECGAIDHSSVRSDASIDRLADALERAAAQAMESSMPRTHRGRHPRKYYNQELSDQKQTASDQRAVMKILNDEESKQRWLEASRKYCELASEVRAQGWSDFLTSLKGHDIWRALRIVKHREGAMTTPELRTGPESWTKGIEERCQVLWDKLLPKTEQTRCKKPKAVDEASWPPLTHQEVEKVINALPRKKAPGLDLVTGELLQAMWEIQEYKDAFFALLAACVQHGYHPKVWREGTVIVLRKPNKNRYDEPNHTDQSHC
jgi:hypothetical protein